MTDSLGEIIEEMERANNALAPPPLMVRQRWVSQLKALQGDPVAWLVKSKSGLVRCALTIAPDADHYETAKYDGDAITPLYAAPQITDTNPAAPSPESQRGNDDMTDLHKDLCERFGCVDSDKHNFYIYLDADKVYVQRKFPERATDSPLCDYENIIILLCTELEKLKPLKVAG